MAYYWDAKDALHYAIVKVSVANMRLQPVFQSELINQLILGTIVPIFEEQNDFYYVQNWDGYLGWISKYTVVVGEKKIAENWQKSPHIMVIENNGFVKKDMNQTAEIITDLVPCTILKKLNNNLKFTKVELPDGQTGYIKNSIIIDEKTQQSVKATKKGIIKISKKFLGIPYLWGGTSTKAFDCSGFVQTVFRLLNVWLPRDASQMAELGRELSIKSSYENLKTGDLLFYGNTLKRITHVAIFIKDSLFIHSEGMVRINSLDPENPFFNAHRYETLLKAQRIL